jgi:hypothetical protein
MSDNTESLGILDKIKALMKGEEAPEAPAVIETGHAEALAAKDAEILALTEKAEADKTANELALSSQSEEFNTQLGDLKTQVEALGSESIGTTIDTVSTEDSSVELSEEENKNNSKRTAEEDIAFYASEETAGRTATVTYKNNK